MCNTITTVVFKYSSITPTETAIHSYALTHTTHKCSWPYCSPPESNERPAIGPNEWCVSVTSLRKVAADGPGISG